ncbi:MAG TPA: hypothetical protein VD793_05490 [Gemmatimonadales bacterium]|nr:hypothetical protein [Gemmatimonadales bacterium]
MIRVPRGLRRPCRWRGALLAALVAAATRSAGAQDPTRRAVFLNTAVDTILLQPDTLRVRVGQTVGWADFSVEARNARGDVVQLVPRILTADPAIAEVTERGVVGRREGQTRFMIRAEPRDSIARPRPVTASLVLIVRP